MSFIEPELERGTQSVVESVRRSWLLVLLITLGFVLLAVAVRSLNPPVYSSTAELVVQDPTTSAVVDTPQSAEPQRYVADQLEILRSYVIAERAAEILSTRDLPPPVPTVEDFLIEEGNLEVSSPQDSNVVRITFSARDAEVAQQGANAVVEAYEQVSRFEAEESSASALDRLDERIADIDRELADIANQIQSALPDEAKETLTAQSFAVLDRILTLQQELLTTASDAQRADIALELEALTQPVAAVRDLVASVQPANLQGLLDQQSSLIARRAELTSRSDGIVVNSELEATGISFASPAPLATRSGLGSASTAALGGILGLVFGGTFVHWQNGRRRQVDHRSDPAIVLDTALLADIPRFGAERISSSLPVRDEPRSAVAESFRFAAAGLDMALASYSDRCIAVVSSTVGDGKTTSCANLGLAAASTFGENTRVLVVDADFGSQQLTSLLIPGYDGPGMTDVVMGNAVLSEVTTQIQTDSGMTLSVLSRGQVPIDAPTFFAGVGMRSLLQGARSQFDLVILDTPPLLQVAYGTTLARLTDAVIATVRHGTDLADVKELRGRLNLIGRPCIGYIYTMAPLREHLSETVGSMADVIGTRRFES